MPFLPPCLHPDCRSAVLRTTWNRFPISVSTYKQKQCPTLCPWAWCFISSLLPSWLLIPWKGWYPGDCFKDRHTEKRDSVSDVLERMKEPTLTLSFSLIHCHYVALQCSQNSPLGSGHSCLKVGRATSFYCDASYHTWGVAVHMRKLTFSAFCLIALMPWKRKGGERERIVNDVAKANNFLEIHSKGVIFIRIGGGFWYCHVLNKKELTFSSHCFGSWISLLYHHHLFKDSEITWKLQPCNKNSLTNYAWMCSKSNTKCDNTYQIWLNCDTSTLSQRHVAFLRCPLWKKMYTDEKLKLVSVYEYNTSLIFWICIIPLSPPFWLTKLAFLLLPCARFSPTCSSELLQNTSSSNQKKHAFFLSGISVCQLLDVPLYYVLVFSIYLITVGELPIRRRNTDIPWRNIFLCLWTLRYRVKKPKHLYNQ